MFFERFKTTAHIAAQVIRGRAMAETLHPKKRNTLIVEVYDGKTGELKQKCVSHNARTNAGANWQATIMGSGAGAPANYLALSTATLTPAAADTTLTGEILSGTNAGLARTQASYGSYTAPSSLNGAASYTLSHTFTSSGTATVNSAALFDAASAGNLFVEANLSNAATMSAGDQIVVQWVVNL